MANLKLSNWHKPSNPKIKFWADLFVYTLPLYLTAIISLPDDALSENAKVWINFAMTLVIITFKMISKLTSSDEDEKC